MNTITSIEEIDDLLHLPLVIILAKSKNCGVCDAIKYQLEDLFKNIPEVPLYDIYIDEIEEFRGRFLVFTVPTVMVYSNGKELLRESRFIDVNKIKRLIDVYNA